MALCSKLGITMSFFLGLTFQALAQSPYESDNPAALPGRGGPTPQTSNSMAPPPLGAGFYKLGRGDWVRLSIFQRQDLSGEYQISDDGKLRVPQVGHVSVLNKTASDVENELSAALAKLLSAPAFVQVDVTVRRPFFVSGLVDRPGVYPFIPGMSVSHAVAVAGGLYRGPRDAASEIVRERYRLQEANQILARELATRARLLAEREAKTEVEAPAELSEIIGQENAESLIANENAALRRQLASHNNQRNSIEVAIKHTQSEIDALRSQYKEIEEQSVIREGQVDSFRGLAGRGVINQQRLDDTEMAASYIARDKQATTSAIAAAERTLSDYRRQLDNLAIERQLEIDREITTLDQSILRSRATASSSRAYIDQFGVSGLQLSATGSLHSPVTYEIVRKANNGADQILNADEFTELLPNDLLRVTPMTESKMRAPNPVN